MKHVSNFYPAITQRLTTMGLDSKRVLDACNAYRGSAKGDLSKVTGKTTLTGKISAKGKDGRRLTFVDNETYKYQSEKGDVPAPGQLLALSEDMEKATSKWGIGWPLVEFPQEIEEWLAVKAISFAPVQGCEVPPAQAESVSA